MATDYTLDEQGNLKNASDIEFFDFKTILAHAIHKLSHEALGPLPLLLIVDLN